MLEQSLSTAQQAQQASNDTAGATTGTVSLTSNSLAAGNLLIATGGTTYTVSITASAGVSTIEAAINGTSGLGSTGAVTASDDGSGHLVLTGNTPNTSFTASGGEQTAFGLASTAVTGTSATRNTLQSNYNSLLTQIDQLAGDASYNGVNLLNGNNLTVNFNETGTSTLTISGVTFNHAGLAFRPIASGGFQTNSTITSAETSINAAITTVRAQTETFGTNSSTIQTRQSFETEHDQHPADRRQQSRARGPEPGKRQLADPANPPAAGNLGTVDRQPGESVGAQAVPVISSGTGVSGGGGAKTPPLFLFGQAFVMGTGGF